jgi:2-(3-amino-3-carboxypropyl)histidine synthase
MIEPERVLKMVRARKPRRIFVQVPEGLKPGATELCRKLESSGTETILSLSPCYGACDLREDEARMLGCDLILHIGHSDYGIKTRIPVIYEEYRIDYDPTALLKRHLPSLKEYMRLCLVTTLQYLSGIPKAKRFLESKGKRVFVGSPSIAKYPGQVLGCDFSAAVPLESVVDCFLFMGTGTFHPVGLAMAVKKPVLFLDYETTELVDMNNEKRNAERMRMIQVAKASHAKSFGILVSTKPGQMSIKSAVSMKKKLENKNLSACILAANEFLPSQLEGMGMDALINTACPRIREDARMFKKPIVNPEDFELLLENL